ncbi:hypothetical protein JHK82_043539 [Glycine max]|nr:hypothetical protein JHK82_043539 [Glycine max]
MVIQNNMRWKVGGGDKIRFWKDKWIHQEETLAEREHPGLYIIMCYLMRLVSRQMACKILSIHCPM